MANSKNYWEDAQLNLYYKSAKDHSIDDNAAKTYRKTATAPETYVTDMQTDLIVIGYLSGKADGDYGPKTKRAITRFQRRAHTKLRVNSAGAPADVASATYFCGITGICDPDTAKEIRLWLSKKLSAPLKRYSLVGVPGGRLRNDVAALWNAAVLQISANGGTLASPYGDTTRSVGFRKSTGGNSLFSLHYTGRAVDLNQGLAGGKGQRYYVEKEVISGATYWVVYCKTDSQTGAQGKKITAALNKKYYSFWSKKEIAFPEGYYINVTEFLKARGFVRIKAHSNWKTQPKGQEWWHFHYDKDLQATFQDEMELLGYDEATLKKHGWNTDLKLDTKPG